MAMILGVVGVSLLTAGLGAGLGYILFGQHTDATGVCLLLACVGALVGAVAGVGCLIAAALRQHPPP